MYDLTVITENAQDVEAIVAHLKKAKAEIKRQTDLGLKSFAYSIEKKKEGVYTTFIIELDPAELTSLNRELTIDPKIMRHLTLKTNQVEPIKTADELGLRNRDYKENKADAKPASKPVKEEVKKPIIVKKETAKEKKDRLTALDKELDQIISEK